MSTLLHVQCPRDFVKGFSGSRISLVHSKLQVCVWGVVMLVSWLNLDMAARLSGSLYGRVGHLGKWNQISGIIRPLPSC